MAHIGWMKKYSIAVNTLSSYYRLTLERRDRAATIIEIAKEERWLRRNGISQKNPTSKSTYKILKEPWQALVFRAKQ